MILKNKFLIIAIVLCYFSFLYIESFKIASLYNYVPAIKYFSIILCFINALIIGKKGHDIVDTRLLQFAMFLTLVADFFLLITQYFIPGILVFCLIQIIYVIRHSRYSKFNIKLYIMAALMLVLSSLIARITSLNANIWLLNLGIIYAIISLCSVFTALSTIKYKIYPKNTAVLIILGIGLLFLCDINVALYNLNQNNYLSGFLIWFFYLPSQLFLSQSGNSIVCNKSL